MAIKELKKNIKNVSVNIEKKAQAFISKGGTLAANMDESSDDHRLTLRIPNYLLKQIDEKRQHRLGKVSRNFFILEAIEKACKK